MNTRRLGRIASETLQYKRMPDTDKKDRYRPQITSVPSASTKNTLIPGIQADAETVTITDQNYEVTFYVYFGRAGGLKFNGIMVKGWPDNDAIERVIEAWGYPRIEEEYDARMTWLRHNPGFKRPLVEKAPQKRVYASERD